MDEKWLKIRIQMLRHGVTFQGVADDHKVSRQYVFQAVKAGYPAEGKKKRILDDFFGRLAG